MDKLSTEQVETYRQVFKLFDQKKDGVISKQELGDVMRSFGRNPTEKEIDDAISSSDYTANGVIDFEDFLIIMTSNIESENDIEDDLKEAFQMFDLDGSGFILNNELKIVMKRLDENVTEQQLNQIMKYMDTSKNGKISYQEFRDFFFDVKK